MKYFTDDGQIIGVKEQDGKTALLVSAAKDIFSVLHYLEVHPEVRGKVGIEKLSKPLSGNAIKSAQKYFPQLREDSLGGTYAYYVGEPQENSTL